MWREYSIVCWTTKNGGNHFHVLHYFTQEELNSYIQCAIARGYGIDVQVMK